MKIPLLRRRQGTTRLAERTGPGVWIGVQRRLLGPSVEVTETEFGDEVDNRPPMHLVAVWRPIQDGHIALRRYPAAAHLVCADGDGVTARMLRMIPLDASLFVAEIDVDWALMAEIALTSDPQLGMTETKLLQLVIRRERERRLEQVRKRYTPREGRGFQATQAGEASEAPGASVFTASTAEAQPSRA